MGNLGLNIDETPPAQDTSVPVPAGDYLVCPVEAAMKTTKAGTGQFIRVVFEVIDGEYRRRKLWQNFTWINPSEKAQEIGRGQFSAMCKAMGMSGIVDDTSEILQKPVIATVAIVESDWNGKDENKITHYSAAPGVVKAQAQLAKVVAGNDSDDIPF